MASQGSQSNSEDNVESGYTITTLAYIESRKDIGENGADLISCGGNGWVRFWNTQNCKLVGEFIAHPQGISFTVYV